MKRYETMSFVRMRQSRRSETQRKARQASHAANSQSTTRAGTPIAPGRAQPPSDEQAVEEPQARGRRRRRGPASVAAKKARARASGPTAGGRGPSGSSGRMRVLNLAPPRVR